MSVFLKELKRRKVFRVGATYSVVAWVLIEVTNNVVGPLNMPGWVPTVVIVLLGLGFPVALILAWAFEVTPEGLKPQAKKISKGEHTPLAFADYALILLMIGVIGVSFVRFEAGKWGSGKETPVKVAEDEKPSIAVLPFANMSPDPEQAYFAEGISEEILRELARNEGFRVISRTSSFALASGDPDVPTIAERLGVGYVIEGSVRKEGNQVRITAQLIDVASDSHLWSATYDRELEDIFTIQEEIAESITGAIATRLEIRLPQTVSPKLPANIEAYQLFLKGRYFARLRLSLENATQAVLHLQQAVDLDPEYSEAWAFLALGYNLMSLYDPENFGVWTEKTGKAAETAFALDPENALALAVFGINKEGLGQWRFSRESLEKAATLETTEAETIYWLGEHLAGMGYLQEGLDQVLKAQEIDPLNPNVYRWASLIAEDLGDYDKGRHYATLAIQFGQPGLATNLVRMDLFEGKYEEALSRVSDDDPFYRLFVEDLVNGRGPEKIIDLISQRGKGYTRFYYRELLAFKEWELALEEFKFALLSRNQGTNHLVHVWSREAAPMRKLPEFKEFVRDLGLPEYWDEYGWPEFCQPVGEDDFECH